MAKVTPTTKSCSEILNLILGGRAVYNSLFRVQTTYDPVSTHALYGVLKSDSEYWKERIKEIGGKYIRVVKPRGASCCIICFALEITREESIKVQMEKEAKEKLDAAYESKKCEIEESIVAQMAGATHAIGKARFAKYLLNPFILDPLIPFENYIIIPQPENKDEKRIYDIVEKANRGHAGCVGMVTTNFCTMCDLACQMNAKITHEDKRMARRAACLKYGLKFLADRFVKN